MKNQFQFVLLVTIALVLGACAVNSQKRGIRDARLSIAAVGIATETTDHVVADVYKDTKPEDTENYCRQKIAGFVLTQVVVALDQAADAVLLWEKSLTIYLSKKEAGNETDVDWTNVLSSESEWFQMAVNVISVLDGLMKTLRLWDVPIPEPLSYAWSFLSGLTGKPVQDFEFDWGDLKESVCVDYLPGKEG